MRAELPALHSCLTGGCSQEQFVTLLRAQVTSNRTRGDSPKLHQEGLGLGVRKDFLSERVARPWKGLPGAVVGSPALEVFKMQYLGKCFSDALGSVRLMVGLDDLKVFSNLRDAILL